MKITPIALAVLIGCTWNYQAHAASTPVASTKDKRIRFVDYDPYDYVTVKARIGRDTLVMFAPGERILDMGGGYTDAWNVGAITAGNGFFMKPARGSPNTNIHILTNKRVYNLDMVLAGPKEINYEFIQYRYPEDELQSRRAKGQADLVKKMLTQGDGRHQNENWTVEGATTIEPIRVVDNGLATYVTFPPRAKIPQIYYENEEGKEVMANYNVNDDVVVIHDVKAKFIFRSGELVTCIYNESYDPRGGDRPKTKTQSPHVERVLKEAEQ
ncbi:TrbG/VirB9 family P-type conjugative transfer protein [Pseudomonas putida]|uniref:Conjugative transfer protein VirB9 n=1 Tax=Pseudomonas putida TaxID=303 RepID=A0A1L7NQ35_PSEPU|nr:TrbG/VirB9 family P-type conjugative transfer protein [Pseudomonas putida]BAW27561.1 Conjugative transfer protein VirB9 [Pseudomonas putida]